MSYHSPWKTTGVDIARILGFRTNPATYVYFRANRYEVNVPRNKHLHYGGRHQTLEEATQARDRLITSLDNPNL